MEKSKVDPDEVFANKYYSLNRLFLRLISLWPYQKMWEKVVSRAILLSFILTMMGAQMARGIEECLKENMDTEIILENFSGFCYFLGVIVKIMTSYNTKKDFQHVYEEITRDWKDITDEGEKNVLRHFAQEGRFLVAFFAVYSYVSCFLYVCSTAMIPIVLNLILTREEPFKPMLCFYAEYFIDQDKYFVYLFIHTLIGIAATVAIGNAVDGTYVNCVQHIIGLFNIIKYRLDNLYEIVSDPVRYKAKDIEDVIHENILYCIKIHKRCLEFTNLLQSAYNACFFSSSCLLIIGYSTFTVDLVINVGNPINFTRIFVLWIGMLIYLFYITWPGQKLIDTSNELPIWICSSGWYQFPSKTKYAIRFMLVRTLKPCMLTAGPLLVMNFETTSFILRTAFSYFTAVAAIN